MSSSCQTLVHTFRECVLRWDCVQKDGRLPSDCLKNHASEMPEECQSVRKAVFDCKRGMLDMRKRFRGNNVGLPPHMKPQEESLAPTSATS